MNLWFDVKYAWRLLLKTPGHSLLCILVIGLSVGLAMCSYALAFAMRFETLPFRGSERWLSIQVASTSTGLPRPSIDAYTYQELLKRNRTVDHLGGFSIQAAVLSESQASTSLRAAAISPRFLKAMQVPPRLGRLFDEAESQPGAAPAAIISSDTWRTHFAADPAIVGKQARIDGRLTRIVGVMPETFLAFDDSQVWLPLQLPNLARPGDSTLTLTPLILLKEGQTPEAVLSEMKAPVDAVNRAYPDRFNAGRHIALKPAHLMFTHQNLEIVATVCFIAAGVLLLGCLNISMIFLARLLERTRELALRTAVGASRGRLLRQCLLETAFVVLFGLSLGWVLATLGVGWMHSIDEFGNRILAGGRSTNMPLLQPIDMVAAVIAGVVIWLLSTLIPAWRVAKQDAAVVLGGSGKGVAGPGSARSASILVGLQITVSSLVLVLCANLVVAIRDEGTKPTGVNTAGIVISTYPTVFDARYGDTTQRLRYWETLTGAIKGRIPAAAIAYATAIPTRPIAVPIAVENQEGGANRGTLTVPLTVVSDEYFELLGIPLRSGRLFDSTDTNTALAVAIVDENVVKRHWPGQSAIGRRIQLSPSENGPWLTVVGVVSNVTRPYRRDAGVLYRPLRQVAPPAFHLIARTPVASADRRAAFRAAAFAVDRDLPLHNIQKLDELLEAMDLSTKSMVPFFTVITLITVILSATGLYGLISRSVARRTQEVGVRRALGGTKWQVTAVFLRQGALYLTIAFAGGALGILVANAITASIPNILHHAVPVSVGVVVVLALVIFTASYLPTRRAVALEPGDALRYE